MKTLLRMLDQYEPPAEGDWELDTNDHIGDDCE